MRIISSEEVGNALSLTKAVQAVRCSLLHRDKDVALCPLRSLIWRDAPLGVFGTMSGYFPRGNFFIVKIASLIPDAVRFGGTTVSSIVLVFSGSNGVSLALIDGASLTLLKTAAVSAFVTDQCAIEGPIVLTVIGSGALAREQLRAVGSVRSLRELRIYTRTRANGESWARNLCGQLSDIPVVVADDIRQACEGADVIATTTTSTRPLFDYQMLDLPSHVHINCMGAHTRESRELPIELLKNSILIVEDRDTAIKEAGDLHTGSLELHEITSKRAELRYSPTVFSSTGHISVDACIAEALLEEMDIIPRRS